MNLLHVDSSVTGSASASRQLTQKIVAAYQSRNPGLKVTYRDVAAAPLQHLSDLHVQMMRGGGSVPEAIEADVRESQAVLAELFAADVIVIGAPMYNFSVPTQLKAWIDRLAVPGKTFRYGANGPEGLAGGRKVIIASTRGGAYEGQPHGPFLDHQEAYLKAFFTFIGVKDVSFVRAEGLAVEALRAGAMQSAHESIAALV